MRLNESSTDHADAPSRTGTLPAITRLKYLRVVVTCSFISGLLLSQGLWFGIGRTFPRVPLLGGPRVIPFPVDSLLSILLVAVLVLSALSRNPRRHQAVAVALALLLIVLDQTRLQPWVYQYLIMLLVMAGSRADDESDVALALASERLVVVALYFWSGAQKLNWSFGQEVLPGLLSHSGIRLPAALVPYLPLAGIGLALSEMMIGIALLIRRTRQGAVVLAVAMHLLVLLTLVASLRNTVVWAWNLSMMLMVASLFWRSTHEAVLASPHVWRRRDALGFLTKAVMALCCVLPALSFMGWWDMYLSAALYSGNTPVAVMRISENVRAALPLAAGRQVFRTGRGDLMLPFYEWSMAEMNVPPYPEPRVYKQIARHICASALDEQQGIELIIKERPSLMDGHYEVRRMDCPTLNTR
jgi:hypothetical protein